MITQAIKAGCKCIESRKLERYTEGFVAPEERKVTRWTMYTLKGTIVRKSVGACVFWYLGARWCLGRESMWPNSASPWRRSALAGRCRLIMQWDPNPIVSIHLTYPTFLYYISFFFFFFLSSLFAGNLRLCKYTMPSSSCKNSSLRISH